VPDFDTPIPVKGMPRLFEQNVREFLDEPRFAVLATINASGKPQQTVMWYEIVDDKVFMNTAGGRLKESNLQRDPRVSLCIEDGYRFVTITGTAELDHDRERGLAGIMRLAHRYHPAERAANMEASFAKEARIDIWVTIDNVLAKGF
jgi:PPOX class probable F420-dependent enzyme